MGKLSSLKSDPKQDLEGIDMPYDGGVVWKVARWGNPRFNSCIQKTLLSLSPPERRRISEKLDEGDMSADFMREAVARFILVGWSNLDDDDGNPIPYTYDQSLKICVEPEYDIVFQEICNFARDVSKYRQTAVEEIAGNSPSSLSGVPSGREG